MKPQLIMGALAALLAGCGGNEGGGGGNNAVGNAAAQGKAEDGRVTVKAPGLDLSVRLPEALRSRMATDADNRILPPNVRIGGVHVQGNASEGGSGGNGTVELTFSSDRAPEAIAAWYRDPARRQHFSIGSDGRQGGALVLGGTARAEGGGNGGRFTVRLSPRQGGGTDGRLSIADRG